MKKTREYAFDILRVISMIMVIIIHIANVYCRSFGMISTKSYLISLIFNTICRVSVPIFFMISGSLLLDRSFNKEKYLKRVLKYVILIVVWDIIYLVWEYFYLGVTYDKLYMLIFDPYRAHLWFLYTILVLYAIQPLLKLIMDKSNNIIKISLLIIWFLLSLASMLNPYVAKFFTIFSYIGYFIIGKYLYDFIKKFDLRKYSLSLILIMIFCYSISIWMNYSLSISLNQFYNLFFAYRTPFIMISSFALYVLIISNYRKDSLNKLVTGLSDLSLGVYLIHGIFLDVTVKVFIYNSINSIIGIPIFTIIIFILSIISTFILKKIKFLKEIVS